MTNENNNGKELSAMAALDCLDADEALSWQECTASESGLDQAADEFKHVVEGLGFLADPVVPPAHLKTRLNAVMKKRQQNEPAAPKKVEQLWTRWPETIVKEAQTIIHADEVAWEPLGKGLHVKNLFVNRAEQRVTMLVKMEAGGSYPPHVHFGPEECYVLSGDFYGENFSMKAGDYQFASKGSKHGVQSTKNGCVILITSSLNDQIITRETTV